MKTVKLKFITETGKSFYVSMDYAAPTLAEPEGAAKVQAAELNVQRADTERQLKIAIRQNLNQMETAMKSYGASQTALVSAQKAYDITAKSYEVGSSTLTDLNDAQLALTQSQLAVSQAVYDFVIAKSSLESTVGADFIDADGNVQLNNTYENE